MDASTRRFVEALLSPPPRDNWSRKLKATPLRTRANRRAAIQSPETRVSLPTPVRISNGDGANAGISAQRGTASVKPLSAVHSLVNHRGSRASLRVAKKLPALFSRAGNTRQRVGRTKTAIL
jgi:hypothetical protein